VPGGVFRTHGSSLVPVPEAIGASSSSPGRPWLDRLDPGCVTARLP
jgi:hypothetical protein